MASFFSEMKETLAPSREAKDGPLPPMMVAMTLVTGLIDAFSYLVLGHVFVANMTGNVVFIAFALVGEKGFSIPSSITALVAFIAGTLLAGRMLRRSAQNRARMLSEITAIQALFLVGALVLSVLSRGSVPTNLAFGLIGALGISMGMQNTVARKLAVTDLTTTVLTLTIVGMGADSHFVGGSGSRAGRRVISVLAMFFGALLGGSLILYSSIVYPVLIALVIVVTIASSISLISRQKSNWYHSAWLEPAAK
jgi:uncharacterized membrane protein YoaK (UPF0700 family)